MPSLAPVHILDVPRAVAIEFPANVQNTDKAVDLVGGPERIAKSIELEQPLELRFRPHDSLEHPVNSRQSKQQGILLKIDISKRHLDAANGDIQKALELAKGDFSCSPSHIIGSTIRFREMSDYQYSTENSPFVTKAKGSIGSSDLEAIKELQFEAHNSTSGVQNLDLIPPPRFSHIPFPFAYAYKQNPAVLVVDDGSGGSKMINTSAAQRLDSVIISWNDPIPSGPKNKLDPPTGAVEKCVEKLKKAFDERPFYTRHALQLMLTEQDRKVLKFSLPHVVYFYRSGPYRGAYVKYGVDPKSSSEYAKYQTEYFRPFSKEEEIKYKQTFGTNRDPGAPPMTVFDGLHLTYPSIQLVDVTDPQILHILNEVSYRDEPTFNDGWYHSRDIGAIRRIVRIKLNAIKEGKQPIDKDVLDEVQLVLEERTHAEQAGEHVQDEEERQAPQEESDPDYEEAEVDEDHLSKAEKKLLNRFQSQGDELGGLFGYVRQQDENAHIGEYSMLGEDSSEDDDDDDDE